MKLIFGIFIISLFSLASCEPNQSTIEDKEAVENDSIDHRQGEGEGEGKVGVAPDKR